MWRLWPTSGAISGRSSVSPPPPVAFSCAGGGDDGKGMWPSQPFRPRAARIETAALADLLCMHGSRRIRTTTSTRGSWRNSNPPRSSSSPRWPPPRRPTRRSGPAPTSSATRATSSLRSSSKAKERHNALFGELIANFDFRLYTIPGKRCQRDWSLPNATHTSDYPCGGLPGTCNSCHLARRAPLPPTSHSPAAPADALPIFSSAKEKQFFNVPASGARARTLRRVLPAVRPGAPDRRPLDQLPAVARRARRGDRAVRHRAHRAVDVRGAPLRPRPAAAVLVLPLFRRPTSTSASATSCTPPPPATSPGRATRSRASPPPPVEMGNGPSSRGRATGGSSRRTRTPSSGAPNAAASARLRPASSPARPPAPIPPLLPATPHPPSTAAAQVGACRRPPARAAAGRLPEQLGRAPPPLGLADEGTSSGASPTDSGAATRERA